MSSNVSIPNTDIVANNAGTHYYITPNSGYVLHDKNYDYPIYDEETLEETGTVLGYRRTTASVGIANYDFTTFETLDESGSTVTAYGVREFFTKLETDVPENQIFGKVNI